jgi:hypothetical protein
MGMMRVYRLAAWLLVFAIPGLSAAAEAAEDLPERVEFNRDIRPILSDRCFTCHGPDEEARKADLRLDLRESATEWAVVPGSAEKSELIARVASDEADVRMPPTDSGKPPLAPREIALLRRWIDQGAEYEKHWSLIPPKRSEPPAVKNAAWPRGAIDRFILARLEREGLKPSPEANAATLLRRLYFDLTGLPPTPEQVQAFLHDPSADAYEKVVDELLASPRFGERMASYWLDLARYADTVGYHGDQEHHISPYRDYVIHAFNENMPFDQFTREQLAGDLLPGATVDQKIASGYNRVLQTSHEGGVQIKEYLAKYSADRVRNVSSVWMGATLGCAECHDHKFDPYLQKDFYSMAAFFADVDDLKTFKGRDTSPTARAPELEVLSPIDREAIAALEARLQSVEEAKKAIAGDAAKREELETRAGALRKEIEHRKQQTRRTMITVSVEPRVIRVLPRGDWMNDSGEICQPAIPQIFGELDTEGRATRLDLANWLVSPDHPQTSRVFVNRLWYLYFGTGLSKTLADLGSQGEWPTHSRLLDWLAVEFVESGWNVKHMVRLLVTSSAYRQSSRMTPELRERDPLNRLYARQSRFRLPAEMIRDNALAVSGLLVEKLGGPSIRPYQPAGYYANLNFPKRKYHADHGPALYRRSVYMHWQRQFLHPMLKAFDAPSREECTAKRPISNTPAAALTLLNDPIFVEAARVFAARIVREGGDAPASRVEFAWREALCRAPNSRERELLLELYTEQLEHYRNDREAAKKLIAVGEAPPAKDLDAAELAAWTAVARAIFNLNEAITRN